MDAENKIPVIPEEEVTLIPEDESVSAAFPIPGTEQPTTDNAPSDSTSDRVRLENEVFQRHITAIKDELEEIRRKYSTPESSPPDPVLALSAQVDELKNGFAEIKNLLTETKQQPPVTAQTPTPVQQTMPQPPVFPTPAWQMPYPYQVTTAQPMFQTSTIMPAPPLTYFSTPTLMPTNTQAPQFNSFSNNNNGGR